jgi:hypothetical protein
MGGLIDHIDYEAVRSHSPVEYGCRQSLQTTIIIEAEFR